MGAWGSGNFQNDDALDWLADLEEGKTTLRRTLEVVARASADSPPGTGASAAALAAAEMVAACFGRAGKALPEDAIRWVQRNPNICTPDDVQLAAKAVSRVASSSELQELFDENGPNEQWRQTVEELLTRLGLS